MKEQLSKRHKIIRYCRRPICFLIVSMIVIFYSFDCFAAGTVGSTESLLDYYQILDVTQMPILYKGAFVNYYVAQGYSSSEINWQQNSSKYFFFTNDSAPGSNIYTNARSLMSSTDLATSYTDGVTYDLSNAYTYISPQGVTNNNLRCCLRILSLNGSKICAVFDNNASLYLVSGSPFIIYQQVSNTVTNVDTISTNGLYCYPCTSIADMYNSFYCAFTDLDIYYPSSTGNSGFTNFSTTSTDLDLTADNVNFNIFKTGEYIVSPGDPVYSPDEYADYVKSRMNFSMTSYYTGGKYIYNAKHDVSIVWPEVVKNNPENFYIVCHYTGAYKDGSLANAITFDERSSLDRRYIKVSGLMKNGKLPNNFEITCGLEELVDANNKSMWQYFLESISAISGASSSSVTSDSLWLQFLNNVGQAVSDLLGIGEDEKPLAILSPAAESYISTMRIDGYVSLCYDNGVDSYTTGENHSYYDFTTGESHLVSSDNTINQYPSEGQDIYNLPSTGPNGDLGTVVQGDVNTTSVETNFNAFVEYMFHIDPSDILGMQASMSDTYNFVKNTITDNGSNGFLKLLSETFDIIPSEIWNWIKASVAMVLMVCTWKIFISNKRLTG